MTPGDLLATLEGYGIRLFVEDGFFRYDAPVGAFNSTIREEVRALRQTLLTDWLCPGCLQVTRVFYGFPPGIRCRRCCDGQEGVERSTDELQGSADAVPE